MSPASNPALPAISSLSTLPVDKLLQVLDTLFEPSPELHDLVAPLLSDQSFSSYDSLMDAVRSQMLALAASRNPPERQTLYGILGSHPRLGASSAAAQAHLSELSRKEQAKINAGTGPAEEEAARLSALNKEYEETYPGLRYVTFVNGRGRDVIMVNMRHRINRGNIDQEVHENIQAMCDIAKHRAKMLQQQD